MRSADLADRPVHAGAPDRGGVRGRRRLRLALVGVALLTALAGAAGIPVHGAHGRQVTGDEPHYLLTAISLAEDRSLDVADEHAERRYRAFHDRALPPQGRPLAGGRLVAPHDPLLPALLAVPTARWGWVGAKVVLSLLGAALAAATLWVAVQLLGVPLGPAMIAVGAFSASAPLAVYSSQIYPEIPAALAVTVGIGLLIGRLGPWAAAGIAGALVSLPWLGTKYVPLACVLAVAALARLIRNGERRLALAFAALLVAAGLSFVAAHHAWYGGWTPYASGEHFARAGEFSVAGTDPDLLGRSTRLISLLVDRGFGLAAWQPAWLLVVPAAAGLSRRRPHGWHLLLFVLVAAWLTATFAAVTMHGWWWPGRHLVAALPAATLAVAWWAAPSARRVWALAAAGLAGVVTHIWSALEGAAGAVTWAVDFVETANPWYRLWRVLLPDYLEVTPLTWVLHAVWGAAACAALVMGWRSAHRAGSPERRRGPAHDPEELIG